MHNLFSLSFSSSFLGNILEMLWKTLAPNQSVLSSPLILYDIRSFFIDPPFIWPVRSQARTRCVSRPLSSHLVCSPRRKKPPGVCVKFVIWWGWNRRGDVAPFDVNAPHSYRCSFERLFICRSLLKFQMHSRYVYPVGLTLQYRNRTMKFPKWSRIFYFLFSCILHRALFM